MEKLIYNLVLLFTITSCAGPMTPFGSIELVDIISVENSKIHKGRDLASIETMTLSPHISISPNRLNLHSSKILKIQINDDGRFHPLATTMFFYNGLDITSKVLKLSKVERSKNKTTYKISNMRFLAKDDHNFSIVYRRSPFDNEHTKTYLYPVCPISGQNKIDSFSSSHAIKATLNHISKISLSYKINPNFIAGLVAQESSFNPAAISTAKAIGLTQITSLAEDHIIRKYKSWPQYPGISKMSYLKTKALITLGKINSKNEWRLDSKKSIRGGMEYLEYLMSYWDKKKNKELILNTFPSTQTDIYEDIILASYNSGAFRVKQQIKRGGLSWIKSRKLREAKKYIRKVKSYCYQFSGH